MLELGVVRLWVLSESTVTDSAGFNCLFPSARSSVGSVVSTKKNEAVVAAINPRMNRR